MKSVEVPVTEFETEFQFTNLKYLKQKQTDLEIHLQKYDF